MNCSLKCFLEFKEAATAEKRAAIVKKYKKGTTEPSKGMIVYYSPALQAMKGRLCPGESLSDILKAIRDKCHIAAWTDKLNDARLESNVLVFKAFFSIFGSKKLKVFSSPRLHCLLSGEVAVTLQPELYAEVDGVPMVWKIGMSKDGPDEATIRQILQMLYQALKQKGFSIPIEQIGYFDVRNGKVYFEAAIDAELGKKLGPAAHALAHAWAKAA
ncbi:MAG: hypothetical protein ACRYGG_18260 [Janthinobacterium lividum]